jgi:hypothetical protein
MEFSSNITDDQHVVRETTEQLESVGQTNVSFVTTRRFSMEQGPV